MFPIQIMKNTNLYLFLIILFGISSVRNGAIDETKLVDPSIQGLYSDSDKIQILTNENFAKQVLNKPKANFVEFYNSWCGHCKRFAPFWKSFAADVHQWRSVVVLGAIDCAHDANTGICREYEILQYPTLKFFHQKFKGGIGKLGDDIVPINSLESLQKSLVTKLQQEQVEGRGLGWPLLGSQNYETLAQVWTDMPENVKAVFLIIESENSTMASEVILDLNFVFGIAVRKTSDTSILAKSLDFTNFPSLVVVSRDLITKTLNPKDATRITYRKAIITYMHTSNFKGIIDLNDFDDDPDNPIAAPKSGNISKQERRTGDVVYQADLETALRYTLYHEIPRIKHISGESLVALKSYLSVVAKYFPFSANGELFFSELYDKVLNDKEPWTGERFEKTVTDLESTYSPVHSTLPTYIGCKGSTPQFRGFTCGLWTMFHVLTIKANDRQTTDASEVLKAIYDYVKYFFGCTDCSQHFQKLAAERFKTVAETDGAIIWLWTAHNEVNHRLAGDETEDPLHPKKQFPTPENCPKCRDPLGSWDFKQVLLYLKHIYGVEQINPTGVAPTISSFDSTLFVLLYIYFAVMIVFVLRLFLTRRIYRKKVYIHDTFGKV